MASTLVQIRVDEKLKDDAAAVYEDLGLDLSTAVRIFLSVLLPKMVFRSV